MSKEIQPLPYTIAWWLNQLIRAEHYRVIALMARNYAPAKQYDALVVWIERRIVRKYGARDYTVALAPSVQIGEFEQPQYVITTGNTGPIRPAK